MPIILRPVTASDLPVIYDQQADPESSAMAAFPSRDREAFDAHWAKIMANEKVILRTIEVDGHQQLRRQAVQPAQASRKTLAQEAHN